MPYSRENTHFGNTVGIDIYHCVAHPKEQPNDFSCYGHWERPKMLGKYELNTNENQNIFIRNFH